MKKKYDLAGSEKIEAGDIGRSRNMSAVRSKNTKPELAVRRFLHAEGFRFRLHRKELPGSPDITMPKYRLAIFVHGCFWHRHEGCFYATSPKVRQEFWEAKFRDNIFRDHRVYAELERLGWRVLVVWECGIKHCCENLLEVIHMVEEDRKWQEWPAVPPRMKEGL